MYLNDLFDYKNQLMHDICCNEEIVKLVTDKDSAKVPNHTLAYTQVYPHQYIPETVDDGLTFICFDVDVPEVLNKTYCKPILYVWVFSHKSKFRVKEGGVRMDKLACEIDKMLNGSRYYGMDELELRACTRFSPILDYHGRMLVYESTEFNRTGQKPLPRTRRQLNK